MERIEIRRREYTRHRDARVALIRCCECAEYYEASVRQARRIRKGESRRLCTVCRNLESANEISPDRTGEYVRWWLEDSGISRIDLLVMATRIYPEEVRTSGPVMSPSRRLTREENNNRSTAPLVPISVAARGQLNGCTGA